MSVAVRPFFSGEREARRFNLNTAPDARALRAGLVFVAPFAEEMNKSRHMVALAARAFAARGVSVLSIDLFGTGDSAGEFAQATWTTWLDDICAAHAWLSAQTHVPVGLWGLRLGATLATAAAARIPSTSNLLLWQPVVSGKAHLTQFLRLKIAADAMEGQARTTTQQLIGELAQGRSVEVAGYALPSAIALPMAQAQLSLPADWFGPIDWIEVAQGPAPTLLPASETIVENWRSRGASIRARAIIGPQFWQTQEIEVCEALIDESLRFADAVT